MINRQRNEILRDVLAVCNGGSIITNIMARAYITHSQAKAYTEQLIASGLLEYDALERKYLSTSEGMRYLGMMNEMSEILSVATKRTVKEQSNDLL